MIFIKRKEGNNGISKKVKKCPHCGASARPKKYSLLNLIIVVGLVWFCWAIYNTIIGLTVAPPVSPELALLSFYCERNHNFYYVRGNVKNISNNALSNVAVIGELKAKDGTLIKSSSALIKYNPIMPRENSPFEVINNDDPLIKTCSVDFKFFTGRKILYINLPAEEKKQ